MVPFTAWADGATRFPSLHRRLEFGAGLPGVVEGLHRDRARVIVFNIIFFFVILITVLWVVNLSPIVLIIRRLEPGTVGPY